MQQCWASTEQLLAQQTAQPAVLCSAQFMLPTWVAHRHHTAMAHEPSPLSLTPLAVALHAAAAGPLPH